MSEQSAARVGIVYVSHSEKIADGLLELARQMAQNAPLAGAGGTDDGRIGTSFEKVSAGIATVNQGVGVVVLCDLGSAILTAETALDFLDDDVREKVRIVDAPLVEGGVAAAVASEVGGSLLSVVEAAESAGGSSPVAAAAPVEEPGGYSRTVTLINKDGLHARPAADFVKLANTFPTKVTVNGTDARSLLGIMAMGLVKGATVVLASDDPAGTEAVDALAGLIETGFGEA
ncbi:dihydroxyacetone kinase phosphoryl donor subunit DhaM [Microterricola viridarii]|uniref:Phosphocarrier protein HPr n=1 Tax=Microterricola viridarii TaxID=412690 RepID=A0A1H1UUJ6_9MICO|nr:dihydroxyacetone kinase phosphoryl donor subunit DhaM [Microterricola viridarii]SDS75931.1 Phosphocarrier protein HPr /dihydroxyacetone kinase DhaM subunit [Microterricola viridarii]